MLYQSFIGYSYLINKLHLRVASSIPVSTVDPKARAITRGKDGLRIPASMQIDDNDLVGHVLFALKNEGVHLEALYAILPLIEPNGIQDQLNATPNGKYVRQMGFLYETFTGHEFTVAITASAYVDLFDDSLYLTGSNRYDKKYKINQNGLGNLDYCPTVRKTDELIALIQRDLFSELDDFIEQVGGSSELKRTLGWAYLSETKSSFDIENEKPSADKAEQFVALLHEAHQAQPLTEDYLSHLQRHVITNPFIQEFFYRIKQNWLQQGGSLYMGRPNVTYIPPTPEDNQRLMAGLLAYANSEFPKDSNEALIKAFMVSFGFVFNHPFLDGNGRISRFLLHHSLCRAGLIEDGFILPLSSAIAANEADYLKSLESVSARIRPLWRVPYIDVERGEIEVRYRGSSDPYRFWDGTEIAEFGLRMAHYALDHSLIDEQAYLERFDRADKEVNKRFDIQNKDRNNLIRMIAGEQRLSKRRRKQFSQRIPHDVLDAVEQIVLDVFDTKT